MNSSRITGTEQMCPRSGRSSARKSAKDFNFVPRLIFICYTNFDGDIIVVSYGCQGPAKQYSNRRSPVCPRSGSGRAQDIPNQQWMISTRRVLFELFHTFDIFIYTRSNEFFFFFFLLPPALFVDDDKQDAVLKRLFRGWPILDGEGVKESKGSLSGTRNEGIILEQRNII